MAKVNEIRYADLSRFLESVGYVGRMHDEANVVWEHPQFERARLFFPAYRPDELVWSGNVAQVRAVLKVHGVLDYDDFDRWRLNLYESEPPNGQGESAGKVRKRVGTPDTARP
jgi:hypothetical protein